MVNERRKLLKATQVAIDGGMNLTAAWGASEILRDLPEDLEAMSILASAKFFLGEKEGARELLE